VVIALLDYAFQRWQYEERVKMSKQEIKDEYKETEGDPLIKSRIRSLQREMARRRMMAEVPSSDVVITNPTHFAVALRYDPERHDAPVVVAKGVDRIAARILEVAGEHRVPLYQAPPIARALYREAELGDPIPADLFQAVAEILAHVLRLAGRMPGR
jgi:flagellar biosynthetic protein FlhB